MSSKSKNQGQFLNLLINVIIPSVILTKLSDSKYLGPFYGLILSLCFPILYGLYEFIKDKKLNFFSALGFVSILLTGGIGLFQLDKKWMVIKETGIPLLIGLVVLISEFFNKSFMRAFLNQILNIEFIDKAFAEKGYSEIFEKRIKVASYLLGSTFFISAILNYFVAEIILKGAPGTAEFNESLGKMTAISFPVISLPMTIMFGLIIYYLFHSIKKYTDVDLESVFRM